MDLYSNIPCGFKQQEFSGVDSVAASTQSIARVGYKDSKKVVAVGSVPGNADGDSGNMYVDPDGVTLSKTVGVMDTDKAWYNSTAYPTGVEMDAANDDIADRMNTSNIKLLTGDSVKKRRVHQSMYTRADFVNRF